MRNAHVLFLAALTVTLAACDINFDDINIDGDVDANNGAETGTNTEPPTDTDTTPIDPIEPESATYYVPDLLNQVWETNTRLEYRDAFHWVETSYNNVPNECMLVTIGVPADAAQGVFLTNIKFGAYGIDLGVTNWMDGVDTGGAVGNELTLSELLIFRDPDQYIGAEAYYNSDVFRYDEETGPEWGELFGCWNEFCHTATFGVYADYYIPPGVDASIGWCTEWWSGPDYGNPGSSDWMHAILGEIQWVPADSQEFTSDSVQGLALPTSAMSFPEL